MVGWMAGWLSLCFVHPKSKSHSAFLCSGHSFHRAPHPHFHFHPHTHIKPSLQQRWQECQEVLRIQPFGRHTWQAVFAPSGLASRALIITGSGLWKCHVPLEKQGGKLLTPTIYKPTLILILVQYHFNTVQCQHTQTNKSAAR